MRSSDATLAAPTPAGAGALALLAAAAAAGAALSPQPWIVLAAAGALVAVFFSVLRPFTILFGLLVLLSLYFWVSGLLLPLMPPPSSAVLSGVKEVALLGLALLVLFRGRILPSGVRLALWAFALLVLLLAVVPAAPLVARLLQARFHIEYLLLLPICAGLAYTARRRWWLVGAILGSGTAVAVGWLSVIGWTGLSEMEYALANTDLLFGEDSDLVNAINGIGMHMALIVAFCVGLLQHVRTRALRWVVVGVLVLTGWALLTSFSRRAILATVLAAIVTAVLARRWRLLLWGGLAVAVVAAYASRSFLMRLSISGADATGGVSLRLEHLWYTVDSLGPLTTLIGHGVGTSGFVAVRAGVRGAVDLHSYYLILVYESGLIGLLSYLALAAFVLTALVRRYRSRPPTEAERGIVLGTIGALVAFFIAGLFGVTNATVPVAPIAWAFAGCSLAGGVRGSVREIGGREPLTGVDQANTAGRVATVAPGAGSAPRNSLEREDG